jgi:hypothetical protein
MLAFFCTRVLQGCCTLIIAQMLMDYRLGRVNDETFTRIQPGMSEREVRRVFGQPASKYPCPWAFFVERNTTICAVKRDEEIKKGTAKVWIGRDVAVVVFFDNRGIVRNKQLDEVFITGKQNNCLKRLLDRIK